MIPSKDLQFMRATLSLEVRDLAMALNVTLATVERWDSGTSQPTGLHEEILQSFVNIALQVRNDDAEKKRISGIIKQGVGALIFYLLSRWLATQQQSTSDRTPVFKAGYDAGWNNSREGHNNDHCEPGFDYDAERSQALDAFLARRIQ